MKILFISFTFLLLIACDKTKESRPVQQINQVQKIPKPRFSVDIEDDTMMLSPSWSRDIEVYDSADTVIWSVMSQDTVGRKYLIVRFHKTNNKNFQSLRAYHSKALKTIFETYGKPPLLHFASSGFKNYYDSMWCVPIAIASSKNEDYQDYRSNYPNSRLTGVNFLFVELANETKAYAPLKTLFQEFGYSLELTGCEKVFGQKVRDLSFKDTLLKAGLSENESVIYDAGMVDFLATKIE